MVNCNYGETFLPFNKRNNFKNNNIKKAEHEKSVWIHHNNVTNIIQVELTGPGKNVALSVGKTVEE